MTSFGVLGVFVVALYTVAHYLVTRGIGLRSCSLLGTDFVLWRAGALRFKRERASLGLIVIP